MKPQLIATRDSIEARLEAIYAARMRAIWDCLALPIAELTLTAVPASGTLPAIYDPHHLLDGELDADGWTTAHWAYDYFPAPAATTASESLLIDPGHPIRSDCAARRSPNGWGRKKEEEKLAEAP
jgi:hypothetical protein